MLSSDTTSSIGDDEDSDPSSQLTLEDGVQPIRCSSTTMAPLSLSSYSLMSHLEMAQELARLGVMLKLLMHDSARFRSLCKTIESFEQMEDVARATRALQRLGRGVVARARLKNQHAAQRLISASLRSYFAHGRFQVQRAAAATIQHSIKKRHGLWGRAATTLACICRKSIACRRRVAASACKLVVAARAVLARRHSHARRLASLAIELAYARRLSWPRVVATAALAATHEATLLATTRMETLAASLNAAHQQHTEHCQQARAESELEIQALQQQVRGLQLQLSRVVTKAEWVVFTLA